MYEALAMGGVGLIIVEMGGIDPPLGLHNRYQLLLNDDEHIPGFREVTDVIHKNGGKTFQQLFHAGPWHDPESGFQPISSSSLTADEMLATASFPAYGIGGKTNMAARIWKTGPVLPLPL